MSFIKIFSIILLVYVVYYVGAIVWDCIVQQNSDKKKTGSEEKVFDVDDEDMVEQPIEVNDSDVDSDLKPKTTFKEYPEAVSAAKLLADVEDAPADDVEHELDKICHWYLQAA